MLMKNESVCMACKSFFDKQIEAGIKEAGIKETGIKEAGIKGNKK